MAIVTVTVNGHDYQVACDDGQEEHLTGLAEFVNKRVSELTKTMGQVGEARLILMASLLIADEVSDYVDEVEALREELDLAADEASEAAGSAVERMADRIESIAARLETG
jgi:cell division protein ZapA